MRLYSFVNCYLSPIQHGIQTAHVVGDMAVKYDRTEQTEAWIFERWASDFKTIIVLAGGNCATLKETYAEILDHAAPLNYPIAAFCEDPASLNGAMTAFGVVLPEHVYEAAAIFRNLGKLEVTTRRNYHFNHFSRSTVSYRDPVTHEVIATNQGDRWYIHGVELDPHDLAIVNIMNRHPLA